MKVFKQLNKKFREEWGVWKIQRALNKLQRKDKKLQRTEAVFRMGYSNGYSGGYSFGHTVGYKEGKINGKKFALRWALVGTRYYRIEVRDQRLYLNDKEFCGTLTK